MRTTYYPLVLIFFALCANQATASPRLDGIARWALNDLTKYQINDATEAAPAEEVTFGVDEVEAACTEAPDVTVAASPAPHSTVKASAALRAIWTAVAVPIRYGVAFFSAANEPAPKPKMKPKPRMLTLF